MKRLVLAAIGVLAVLVEMSVAPYASIRGIRPDIVMAYVVLVGMIRGPYDAILAGLAAGLVEDACSGQFLGLSMLTRMAVGLASGMSHDKVFQDRTIVPVALVFLGGILGGVLNLFLLSSFGVRLPATATTLRMGVYQALYSAALAPLAFRVVMRVIRGYGERGAGRWPAF